jgi:hypothetical protein
MSPYIVTTKTPADRPSRLAGESPPHRESRCAVATLAEAERIALEEVAAAGIAPLPPRGNRAYLAGVDDWEWIKRHSSDPVAWDAARDACYRLSEQGGMVGPLPDGTVIEVELTDNAAQERV